MDVGARLARYPPAKLESPLASLDRNERELLSLLVEAGRVVDRIFREQADRRNADYRRMMEAMAGPAGAAALAYFRLHQGVYDRGEAFEPFLRDVPERPAGAGFYPADLTREEMEEFIAAHPDREAEMISMTTRIDRNGEMLVGTHYSQAYAGDLASLIETLKAASALHLEASTSALLETVVHSLETDRYQEQARIWAKHEGLLDFVVGAFETGEDRLFSYKAAFESVITVRREGSSAFDAAIDRLRRRILPEIAAKGAARVAGSRGAAHPRAVIVSADLVHASGYSRAGRIPLVFALPVPPDVVLDEGPKRIILDNVARAKSAMVLEPLAHRVLDAQTRFIPPPEALPEFLLLVEVSRDFVEVDTATESRILHAIRAEHLALLAAEARQAAASPRVEAAYVLNLLRRALLGPEGDDAEGAWLQLGALIVADAIRVEGDGLVVQWPQVTQSARLSFFKGEKLDAWAEASRPLRSWRARLSDLPVDIRPVFPLAGEVIDFEPR